MDTLKIFKILGIDETRDKDMIKSAYRRQLTHANPEEDPQGFMELRQAYEEANLLADHPLDGEAAADTSPLGVWIGKLERHYNSLSSRTNMGLWRELLSDDVCMDLDMFIDARNRLLYFMLNHFRLSTEAFKLIDDVFLISEDKEELKEHFPIHFLNYIEYQSNNEQFFDLDIFVGEDEAAYDDFIAECLAIKEKLDNGDYEGLDDAFDGITRFGIYHPFLDVERLRYCLARDLPVDYDGVDALIEKHADNPYVRLHLANLRWNEDRHEEAREYLVQLLEQYPEHYTAKLMMARYYYHVNDYKKAKEECETLLGLSSNDEAVYDLLKQANGHVISEYEAALRDGSLDIEDILELCWCYYENERSEECLGLLTGMNPDEEHVLDYHNLLGRVYVTLHEYEKALPLLAIWQGEIERLVDDGTEKYKKRRRRYVLARYLQALCHHELGNDQKALEFLDFNIDEWDDIGIRLSCHTLKAEMKLASGRAEECISICMHVISIQHAYFPAYVYMQQAYEKLQNAQMVVDTFYQAIDVYPDYVKVYTLTAEVYLHVRQYGEARNIIQMARGRNLADPVLDLIEIKAIRFSAATNEQTAEVLPLCDALVDWISRDGISKPSLNEAYFEKIYAYMDMDQYAEALDIVNECIRSFPDVDEYYRIKAKVLYGMEQYKEALTLFISHKNEDEYDGAYVFGMAICYEKSGQEDKAIEHFKETLDINERHYLANHRLADIYMERIKRRWNRDFYKLAIYYSEKQLEINDSGYYYIECALVYMEGYDFDKALEHLSRVLEMEPDNPYAYNNIGWIYQLSRRDDEAIEMYRRAIMFDVDKKMTLPRRNLADMYIALHRYKEAHALLLQCQKDFKDVTWYGVIGDCMKFAGSYREAIRAYKLSASSSPPRNTYITESIALCYEAAGSFRAARVYHARYMRLTNASARAYNNIGDFYLFCKNNLKRAYKYYHSAYMITSAKDKSSSEYMRSLLDLIEVSCRMGNGAEAETYYEETMDYITGTWSDIENYIDWPSYKVMHIYRIFRLYYFSSRIDKAEGYMRRLFCDTRCVCCEYDLCMEALTAKGYCHLYRGERGEAVECFERVHGEDPNDTRARYELSRLKG